MAGDADDRSLRFEELAARWLASRKPELKPSSYARRETAVKGLSPFFKGHLVRAIGSHQMEVWKTKRGANLSARSWNIEMETLKQIFAYAKDELRILIEIPLNRSNVEKSVKLPS